MDGATDSSVATSVIGIPEDRMSGGNSTKIDRRQFLCGAAAGAAFLGGRGRALGSSPNGRVTFAGIGVGSQGGGDVDAVVAEGGQLVALCDVDSKYAGKKFAQYPQAKQFKDYRVMLDALGDTVDAVVI